MMSKITYSEDIVKDLIAEILRDEFEKLPNNVKKFIEDNFVKLFKNYMPLITYENDKEIKEDIRNLIAVISYNTLESKGYTDIEKISIVGHNPIMPINANKSGRKSIFYITQKIIQKDIQPIKMKDYNIKELTEEEKNSIISNITKIEKALLVLKLYPHKDITILKRYKQTFAKSLGIKKGNTSITTILNARYKRKSEKNKVEYSAKKSERYYKDNILKAVNEIKEYPLHNAKKIIKNTVKIPQALENIKNLIQNEEIKKDKNIYALTSVKQIKRYINDTLKDKISYEQRVEFIKDYKAFENNKKDHKEKKGYFYSIIK